MKISDITDYLSTQGDAFQFLGNKDIEIKEFSTPNNPKNNSLIWIKHSDGFDKKQLNNIKNRFFLKLIFFVFNFFLFRI